MSDIYMCPSCKERTGVPIMYGANLSSETLAIDGPFVMREIISDDILLSDHLPDRQCKSCGHEWRIRRGAGE